MSGPKWDTVDLEEERKRELERKRQEKINAILAFDKEVEESKKCLSTYNQYSELLRDVPQLKVASERWESIFSTHKEYLLEIVNMEMPSETNQITRLTNQMSKNREEFTNNSGYDIKEIIKRVEAYLTNKENENRHRVQTNISNKIEVAAFSDLVTANAESTSKETSDREETIESEKRTALSEIQATLNQRLPKDIVERLNKWYSRINGCQERAALQQTISEYNTTKVAIRNDVRRFSELFNKYNALISYVNSEKLFSVILSTDLDNLDDKVERIEKQISEANKQKYIKDAIRSVLKEFGHDVCEEIVFSASSQGYNMINYNPNGNSGIHTYVSENGKIMMEVVGVEHSDDICNNSSDSKVLPASELTPSQRENIYKNQILFCQQHQEICKKLREEYGVVLTCGEHFASNKEYSKVIKSAKIRHNNKFTFKNQQIVKEKYLEIK